MTRREYTNRVLAALRRVTPAERIAIQAEIDGHMEDHICGLLDLGYSPELAEERTMSFMGDPEEVGRELNQQYPLGWLILKRVSMTLTAVLVVLLLTGVDWQAVQDNLLYRFCPSEWLRYEERYDFLKGDDTDLRVELGPSVVRICAARVTEIQPGTAWAELFPEERYMAVVVLRTYRKSLFDLGSYAKTPDDLLVRGRGDYMGSGSFRWVPVERDETALTAVYQAHGYDVSVSIPLDWGDIP